MIEDDEDLIMNLAKGNISEEKAIRQGSISVFLRKLKHHLNGLRHDNNKVGD